MNWCRIGFNIAIDLDEKELSSHAKWLFVASIVWCARRQTDGRIGKRAALRSLISEADVPAKTVEELAGCGLWLDQGDCWEVKNYLRHQESSERIEAKREAQRRRQSEYKTRKADASAMYNGDASADTSAERQLTTLEEKRKEEKRKEEEDRSGNTPHEETEETEVETVQPTRMLTDDERRKLRQITDEGLDEGKRKLRQQLAEMKARGEA